MSNINRNEIIEAVAMHDIRWIRKNFYLTEFKDELNVNILLVELSEYRKSQDKEKSLKLPSSLLTFFDKHYINDEKAIENLKETLICNLIIGKRILILHESSKSKHHFMALQETLQNIAGCEVSEPFELKENPIELIKLLQSNNKFNYVFYCLSKSNDTFGIISMLMYLIGHFGIENVCVVYDAVNENKEITNIANKWNVSYDSYIGLGL